MHRPNVLFIVADDHRHDCLSVIDRRGPRTPVLDGLAAGGAMFRGARIMGGANGAVCVPSRAALHTGCAPHHALVPAAAPVDNGTNCIRPQRAMLAETFQAAGYRTFATGKWHNDTASFNRAFTGGEALLFRGMATHYDPPLQDYDPSGQYPASAVHSRSGFSSELFADAAIRFLECDTGAEPFFLSLAFTSPHDPRTPPSEYRSRYDETALPLPSNFLHGHPFDNGQLKTRDEKLAAWPRDPAEIRRHLADYYGMISHHDAQIGRVLDCLEKRGLRENTIIVYVSDHGLAIGQHGLMGKQNLYEHSIRVPLIISGPGVSADRVVGDPVYSYRLFATLCDLAGLACPASVMGPSLRPLLSSDLPTSEPKRHFAYYRSLQSTVREACWKLIEYHFDETRRTQLFDLRADPWEMHDRSSDSACAEHRERLQAALKDWRKHELKDEGVKRELG